MSIISIGLTFTETTKKEIDGNEKNKDKYTSHLIKRLETFAYILSSSDNGEQVTSTSGIRKKREKHMNYFSRLLFFRTSYGRANPYWTTRALIESVHNNKQKNIQCFPQEQTTTPRSRTVTIRKIFFVNNRTVDVCSALMTTSIDSYLHSLSRI